MGDKPHKTTGVNPDVPTSEEVAEQLRQSRATREGAEVSVKRAEETASDMSRILRKIASAMDRNPQNWDALFLGQERP